MIFLFCFNVHRITLQLLVNQECGQLILALKRNSLDLLAATRVTTCTHTQLHKNFAFSRFSRVFRHVGTKKLTYLKKKIKTSLQDSNLPSL